MAEPNSALESLRVHEPLFQLRSGAGTGVYSSEDVLAHGRVDTSGHTRANHAASLALLEFLAATVTSQQATVETGAGWSTVVLATAARRHVCVNPDVTANGLIRTFITEHGLAASELAFVDAPSDQALPSLDGDFDLALIDGSHSFPMPIIDWHYLDRHLDIGGLLVIDDTQIRSVAVLCDYLRREPAYVHVRDIGTTAVLRKVAERSAGWAGQPFNRLTTMKRLRTTARRLAKRALQQQS